MPQRSRASETHLVKDVLQTLLRQRRTLHILHRTQFPREAFSLLRSDGPLLLPLQFLQDLGVVPQIDLRADNEARDTGTVMVDLREPLLLDVLKRCRRRHAEANQEHVRLRV